MDQAFFTAQVLFVKRCSHAVNSVNQLFNNIKTYICGSLPKISVTTTKGTYESHNRLRNHQQDLWELCIKSCIMFHSSDLGFLEYLGSLGTYTPRYHKFSNSASCQVTLGLISIHGWNEKHTKFYRTKKSGKTHTQKKTNKRISYNL